MFSVLVADHDKTLPEMFFFFNLSLLRRRAAGTDNSRVNFRNVRLSSLRAHTFLLIRLPTSASFTHAPRYAIPSRRK